MKRIFLTALAMVVIQAACGTDNRTLADPSPNRANRMKIGLKVEGKELTATLIDSKGAETAKPAWRAGNRVDVVVNPAT